MPGNAGYYTNDKEKCPENVRLGKEKFPKKILVARHRGLKKKKAKLKRLTNNRKGVSQRKFARKFNVNQATICRQLSKMNIKYRKREKTPKYNDEQRLRPQKSSRKLVNHLYKEQSVLILDDEKYFCFAGD